MGVLENRLVLGWLFFRPFLFSAISEKHNSSDFGANFSVTRFRNIQPGELEILNSDVDCLSCYLLECYESG